MKKYIALLLALCLAVSMVGCGASKKDPATTTTTTTTTAPKDDSSEKTEFKSYTGTDEAAAAARPNIVATVGDRQLTNGEFNVCYWMGVYSFLNNYGYYATQMGLDYTKPLDTQATLEGETSWQEYFIEDALAAWHAYQAVALAAAKLEISMPEDLQAELDGMMDMLAESAKENGFESADAMLQAEAGAGCNSEDYYTYTLHYYEYLACMMHLSETTEITDADIEEYFLANAEALAESGIKKDGSNVFGVRHILISPEGGTTDDAGKTTYSETEWEACRQKAQKLMDEWAGGTATEETFANYAKTYSTDPGSASNGGLYEDLDSETSFVEPFKDWYLAEGRKVGDYGLVLTDYGYHIMYLSTIEEKWISHCRGAILDETIAKFIEDAQKEHPIESDMDKIVLGNVELAANS